MKRIFLTGATAIATLAAVPALGDTGGFGSNGYGGHMMWGGGYGFLGGAMMLLFWGTAILLVVFAVRWLMGRDKPEKNSSALDILKERLAKGEIEPDEYEARRKVLTA